MDYMESTRKPDDMEYKLEADKPWSEDRKRSIQKLADLFTSQDQIKEKGELISSFTADKKGMVYRVLLVIAVILASLALLKISLYFVIVSVILMIGMTVWLKECFEKYQMFIDIYENAIVGRFEFAHERKLTDLEVGTAYYKKAQEDAGNIYITLYDDSVCRLRHMKDSKKIVYLLNKQKGKKNEERV